MNQKTNLICVCGKKLHWITDDSGCGNLRCIECVRTSGYCLDINEAKQAFERHYNHKPEEKAAMSEQRNADKDRDTIEGIIRYGWGYAAHNVALHWLERAVAAEAEAEKWRKEALQQYLTPDAYEAVCAALEKHRARAVTCEAEVYKWREKALQQEQRVAELTALLKSIPDQILGWNSTEMAYDVVKALIDEALKGGTE